MKKLIITGSLALACVAAYGQGVIAFAVNNDNLIYFTTDPTQLAPLDMSATYANPVTADTLTVAGSTLAPDGSIAALAGSPTFTAYLYAGTSASSLSLQTTTTLGTWAGANIGQVNNVNATFNGPGGSASLPSGVAAYMQVLVSDNAAIPGAGTLDPTIAGNAWTLGYYTGMSPVFQATPGPGGVVAVDTIYDTGAPSLSTWAGSSTVQPVDVVDTFGPDSGYFGGIEVSFAAVPEPGTFALAGLGLAALLVFRRRK